MPSTSLSRREFLKLGGAAAAGFAFRDFPVDPPEGSETATSTRLGRTTRSLRYYQEPSFSSPELGYYITDAVVEIYAEMKGDTFWGNNATWLRTQDGWIHSAFVQPVRNDLNVPLTEIPNGGMLAEVTVPLSQTYLITRQGRKRTYRFYYGSTYWVDYATTDSFGDVWYQVRDDLKKENKYLLYGKHMRPIPAEELTPISLDVADKRIEVDLTRQLVVAYENGKPVYVTLTSTGAVEGSTPRGEFTVERKQPSRHMAATEGNGYDLPGVPWVCFIHWNGVSLHGTYWHNNFGNVMSHGCINLTPEAAKWFFRWTMPVVAAGDDYEESETGTRVIVF